MSSKTLLKNLLAAGVSALVSLSCVAMAACTNNGNNGPNDQQTGDTTGGDNTGDDTTGGDTTGGTNDDDTTGGDNTGGTTDDDTTGGTTGGDTTGGDNTGGTTDDDTTGGDTGDTPVTSTPLPEGNKIYLVGDSTVCDYSNNREKVYMPKYGYGEALADYMNCEASQVVNLAVSGESSLSFLTDDSGNYNTLKSSISTGDYLIIGFGHNDEKSEDSARYTDPTMSYTDSSLSYTDDKKTNGPSFQYTLYENYIKLAEEKGATPILCTPIVRYATDGVYDGNEIHDTDKGDYAEAIRTLGEATDTTVIDLTTITKNLYLSDNAAAQLFHKHTSYEKAADGTKTPTIIDKTHLSKYGAQRVAYELTRALLETDNTLRTHILTDAVVPSDPTVSINTSYTVSDYTAPDLTNLKALANIAATDTTSASTWYATVFGNGISKATDITTTYSNGTFTVTPSSDTKGKFHTTDGDGFGGAFMQISTSTNFTITVTATIKKVPASTNGQGGFGIMLRDDMFVNDYTQCPTSNFAAAGLLLGMDNKGSINFSRYEKTRVQANRGNISAAVGEVYTLTLQRQTQNVICTVVKDGGTPTVTTLRDYTFDTVDNEYMYICLFSNRGLVVEYSDIQYTYDGEAGIA